MIWLAMKIIYCLSQNFNPEQDFMKGLVEANQWFEDNWKNIDNSADFGPGLSSAVR